ncbi:MAG: hypothetical protein ABIG96_02045 [Candidatus Micrarchaeota archaeon]
MPHMETDDDVPVAEERNHSIICDLCGHKMHFAGGCWFCNNCGQKKCNTDLV